MNYLSGHSSPLAFLFKRNNDVVQMWTKKTTTDEHWVGRFPNDNSIGWELFHHLPPPDESPDVILPTPIADKRFDDLPMTFDWLDTTSINWWEKFMENQFFMLPQNVQYPDHIWDVVIPAQRPNDVDVYAAGVQRERTATVHVVDQIPQAAHEFTVGELIAVRPDDDAHAEKPFWIAKITEVLTVDGGSLKFDYYRVSEKNGRKYRPDPEHTHGSCKFTAVLIHGFQLTTTDLIRQVTLRRIDIRL